MHAGHQKPPIFSKLPPSCSSWHNLSNVSATLPPDFRPHTATQQKLLMRTTTLPRTTSTLLSVAHNSTAESRERLNRGDRPPVRGSYGLSDECPEAFSLSFLLLMMFGSAVLSMFLTRCAVWVTQHQLKSSLACCTEPQYSVLPAPPDPPSPPPMPDPIPDPPRLDMRTGFQPTRFPPETQNRFFQRCFSHGPLPRPRSFSLTSQRTYATCLPGCEHLAGGNDQIGVATTRGEDSEIYTSREEFCVVQQQQQAPEAPLVEQEQQEFLEYKEAGVTEQCNPIAAVADAAAIGRSPLLPASAHKDRHLVRRLGVPDATESACGTRNAHVLFDKRHPTSRRRPGPAFDSASVSRIGPTARERQEAAQQSAGGGEHDRMNGRSMNTL